MSAHWPEADLVLIQGLVAAGGSAAGSGVRHCASSASSDRDLGLVDCERLDGRGMGLANRLLRRKRGTALPPDAVVIMSINENALRRSLACEAGRALWRERFCCQPQEYRRDRSFILMGRPRVQLAEQDGGLRLLWFGNGLGTLSRAEFIAHYTGRHGPLVAGHAQLIGLRGYRQVPDEEHELCAALCELGLGDARPPAVFGELLMGAPPLSLAALRDRRAAIRDIEADERRHIDFGKSMLLLTGRK